MEGPKNAESTASFTFPNVEMERGEIERVAVEFAETDPAVFTTQLVERSKGAGLITMSEEMWSTLENTDSYDIPSGDWEAVEHHSAAGHSEAPRDWQKLKSKMENGESLDAPIICHKAGRFHLVSGNTRLMVARALGQIPQVLLVNMDQIINRE